MADILVIGAGAMGQGIAQAALLNNCRVYMHDINKKLTDQGIKNIYEFLSKKTQQRKITEEDAFIYRHNVYPVYNIADAVHCKFVIEAALEDLFIKEKIFSCLDSAMNQECILASNTSSLSITAMAAVTRRPDKVIGLHFFNPASVMPLVEVIRGSFTSDDTCKAALELCAKMGKTAVTVNEAPGFVVNRILIPMINEAVFILSEGIAGAEEIDKAMCLGANHKIGPLALADLIGLDVCLAIMESLHANLGEDKYRPAPLLRKMVQSKQLGHKTGSGFFATA